jgi:hypothetical protein
MKNFDVASRRYFYIKVGVFILLLLWLGFLLARKIDPTSADLGRHIKNGEWVLTSGFNLTDKKSPLFENYYSYTNPDFPVINHHWGSGVLFYLIWKFFGFSGLSLIYIFFSLAAFALFFRLSCKESNFTLTTLVSLCLFPLIAERTEVRPEVFSVFFSAIFFYLLWQYSCSKINWRWLLMLIPFQIIWVNFHVYFFLGPFFAGVFFFEMLLRKKWQKAKMMLSVLGALLLASLLNPFGSAGLIYPLKIFQNYGYTIVENKSVSFVESYGVQNPNFFLIKAALILIIISWAISIISSRKNFSIALLMLSVFFGAIGWIAIRNFTLLGVFALPVLAINFSELFPKDGVKINIAKENAIAVLYIALTVLIFLGNYRYISAHFESVGVGLHSGTQDAGAFVREKKIKGPIFNNYDVGGYLIFNLPESEKVFVDNRPEAYPAAFFSDVYKPMQEKESIWQEQENKWNFNAVIIYWHDITPWGKFFLTLIQKDQDWDAVYKDDFIEIFVKNNETNKSLIEKYKIE